MRPRNLRKATVLTVVALFVTIGFVGTSRSASAATHTRAMQNVSMVLDWYPNSDHGGIFTAITKGYFKQHNINMTAHVPSDTSAQIKLVAAGRADFGITYETDLLAAQLQHIPVRSVMCIMQHPLNTLMALKSSGITRPRQLVGRSVGSAGVPSDNVLIKAMMRYDHADASKAKIVNVGFNLLPALLSKRVDALVGAYWNWEAVQAQLKGQPVNVMRLEQWGVPNYCELVVITNTKTVTSNPGLVRGVVQALQQGYAYAERHPSIAWDALHQQDKTLDQRLVLRSLALLKPVILGASTIGYQDGAQWQRYSLWLSSNKLISGPVTARKAFTNQFLKSGVR